MDTDEPTDVCGWVREVLSSVLDGEAGPGDTERLARAHAAGCHGCARWFDQAARLDRLLRIGLVTAEEPDLTGVVLSRVRLRRREWWRAPLGATPLRVALLLVALAQLVIGVLSLSGPIGMGAMMSMTAHMDHEEAAFNIAFGIALLWVVWDSRRAAAQLPVLAAFVLVIGVSSVFDVLDGAVTWPRLLTHAPILAGLLLTAALARTPAGESGPLPRRRRPPDVRGHRGPDDAPLRPSARTGRHGPRPAARRDAA